MSLSVQECNRLTGRIVWKNEQNFTVTSVSTTGEIHVYDPMKNELLIFRDKELFDNWAYGTPIPVVAKRAEEEG